MSLTSNPFHVLGAKTTDDRRRIIALAREKSFGGDEAAVREAQGILLTPRKRLEAEIAWLPGVEPEQIGETLTAVERSRSAGNPAVSVLLRDLPALARANLLAHQLVRPVALDATASEQVPAEESWAKWIAMLAGAHQAVRVDEVTALVNEARLTAGVPMASKQDVVEELRNRASGFRSTIEHSLDGLSMPVMVKVVTSAVNMATRDGSRHAPALIDALIDSYYERRVSGAMDERRTGIANLVSRVRTDVANSRIGRVPAMVTEIERSLRTWDVLAQPIQVSLASRGMSHSPSDEIMRDTRNLAVELFNKHGLELLDVVRSLTETLRQVFAEMEPITELLDEDVATLDGIAEKVEATRSREGDGGRAQTLPVDDVQLLRRKEHTSRRPRPGGQRRVGGTKRTDKIGNTFRTFIATACTIAAVLGLWVFIAERSTSSGNSLNDAPQTTGSASGNRGEEAAVGTPRSRSFSTPNRADVLLDPFALVETAPAIFRTRFQTTKGTFFVNTVRSWAPNGADRFYNLVKNGYYDDMRIPYVVEGFGVWFGVHGDPRVSAAWQRSTLIVTDSTGISNFRGTVHLWGSTAIFVNLSHDNSYLDGEGAVPIGRVLQGMGTVTELYSGYGSGVYSDSTYLRDNSYWDRHYPELDRILTATIVYSTSSSTDHLIPRLERQDQPLEPSKRSAREPSTRSTSTPAEREIVHEAAGRGPDVVTIVLPAGSYTATVGVSGHQGGYARVYAAPLGYGSSWLFKSGSSLRGVRGFSLPNRRALHVDVEVTQHAEWTIRIEKRR